MSTKLRIGAVNWDNSLPPETYFGHYSTQVLSPEKYRAVTPYYARLEGGQVTFAPKTQESFDRELEKAISAGIDYFAYDWYTDEKPEEDKTNPANVDSKVWELNHARHLHQSSILAEKIHLCALIICPHPMSEKDMENLAETMKQPYYETVDGRPLVYLYGGYNEGYIDTMRQFPQKYGTKNPFLVFMDERRYAPGTDYSKADGVCAYACCALNTAKFSDVTDYNLECNEYRKQYGVPIVPHFSMGWNPMPRVDRPIPWTTYPAAAYAPPASEEEILQGALRLADWVKQNKAYVLPDTLLAFAWNEFEEGGFICPTLSGDVHLKAFAKAAAYWREQL